MNLRNENGWAMSERQLKDALGLPHKLPRDFTLERTMVGNVAVFVTPSRKPKSFIVNGRKVFDTMEQAKAYADTFLPAIVAIEEKVYRRHDCKHRVMAECPKCGKVVAAGRLQQHLKVHKKETA